MRSAAALLLWSLFFKGSAAQQCNQDVDQECDHDGNSLLALRASDSHGASKPYEYGEYGFDYNYGSEYNQYGGDYSYGSEYNSHYGGDYNYGGGNYKSEYMKQGSSDHKPHKHGNSKPAPPLPHKPHKQGNSKLAPPLPHKPHKQGNSKPAPPLPHKPHKQGNSKLAPPLPHKPHKTGGGKVAPTVPPTTTTTTTTILLTTATTTAPPTATTTTVNQKKVDEITQKLSAGGVQTTLASCEISVTLLRHSGMSHLSIHPPTGSSSIDGSRLRSFPCKKGNNCAEVEMSSGGIEHIRFHSDGKPLIPPIGMHPGRSYDDGTYEIEVAGSYAYFDVLLEIGTETGTETHLFEYLCFGSATNMFVGRLTVSSTPGGCQQGDVAFTLNNVARCPAP